MDAVMRPFPRDQTFADPNKQKTKTPKKNIRSKFISNPSRGLLNPPPSSSLHPHPHPHRHAHYALLRSSSSSYQQNSQPPLLPLPTVPPIHHPLLSPSSSNQKNKTRNMSLTPKKSKPTVGDIEVKKRATQSLSEFFTPKHTPVVFASSTSRSTTGNGFDNENDIGMFSNSVFNTVSPPPPSSLPLPKFCMRSKLNCNTVTGGGGGDDGDAGATHDLRRILRLQ